ncbi:hypothetical protein [Aeromonas hydrophila]|uniref:hypothetical protein n=1 Tax=Aeromonas hydrophila TaxID=644 RepID=UPI001F5CBB9E|nr:hypothetical protein [Aeromonas hydrophila]
MSQRDEIPTELCEYQGQRRRSRRWLSGDSLAMNAERKQAGKSQASALANCLKNVDKDGLTNQRQNDGGDLNSKKAILSDGLFG